MAAVRSPVAWLRQAGGRPPRLQPALPFARYCVFAVSALLLLGGCKRGPKELPSTPPEVAKALVQRLENNEPQVLWEAMPPSYQADLRSLIGEFCSHMDPEVYDRMFRILNKGVRVMKEKQEYFYKSPVALSTPMIETMMGDRWNSVVSLLNSIATSDLSSLESLRGMDPGRFLESTGQEVMAAADQLRRQSERKPGPNPWQKVAQALDEAHIQFQSSGQDRGWLRFGSTTNAVLKDVELVRVDGKWIPQPMAEAWKDRVAKAREGLARLDGPEFKKAKPMIALVMGTLDTAMDSLLRAGSQKEFDDTLKGLAAVGTMMQSFRPKTQ
jgi:hypothetical protein